MFENKCCEVCVDFFYTIASDAVAVADGDAIVPIEMYLIVMVKWRSFLAFSSIRKRKLLFPLQTINVKQVFA